MLLQSELEAISKYNNQSVREGVEKYQKYYLMKDESDLDSDRDGRMLTLKDMVENYGTYLDSGKNLLLDISPPSLYPEKLRVLMSQKTSFSASTI